LVSAGVIAQAKPQRPHARVADPSGLTREGRDWNQGRASKSGVVRADRSRKPWLCPHAEVWRCFYPTGPIICASAIWRDVRGQTWR